MEFPFNPPFPSVFAERIPLVQAFRYSLANYIQQRVKIKKYGFKGKLKLLINRKANSFNAAECGVYTGSSLIACGMMAKDTGIPFHIWGLDTFTGLPDLSDKDKQFAPINAPYLEKKFFDDTSIETVQTKIKDAKLQNQITLLKGLFSESLPFLDERKYHFVNIDCDLYEPHLECLEYFYSRMFKGGVIFFDDYHSGDYPMAQSAINEFLHDKPEKLFHLRYGDDAVNRTKSFIVKF